MKLLNSLFRILILSCIGSVFAYVLYNSYHKDNLFDLIIYGILGIVWSIIFYLSIRYDKQNYLQSKKINSFASTVVGVVFFAINLGIFSYYQLKLLSPNLIKAEGHGVYAYFKKSGEYIIKSGSWASKTHYYGKYKLQDDLIILDRDSIDKVLFTNKYKICTLTNPENKYLLWKIEGKGNYILPSTELSSNQDSLLLGFDTNGKKIYGSYRFEIKEDKRTNKD